MISRVIPSGFDFRESSQCESQCTKCDIVHSMCHIPGHLRTGIASPWILGNSEDPSGCDHLPEGGSGSLVSIGAVGKTAQSPPMKELVSSKKRFHITGKLYCACGISGSSKNKHIWYT